MKKGVTLKDIAKKLNMSVSTVSKALSNDTSISLPTKERVKELAVEWNYIPNEAARHFKLSKTFTLGLIIPDLLDQYYVLSINGVEQVAAFHKYQVIVAQSRDEAANEEKIIDLMIRSRVDGVIASIAKNTVDMHPFQRLKSMGIPVVFFARSPKEENAHCVYTDSFDGALKATDFLLQKGHRRIAHLMGPHSLAIAQTRLQGYKKALDDHALPFDPHLVKEVDFSPGTTFQAMRELMQFEEPPTAVFSFKNYINLDAVDYLKNNMPAMLGKIDFAGFGNLPMLQYLQYKPVASVEESPYTLGEEAARLVFSLIHNKEGHTADTYQRIKIPCTLIVHENS